jgi:hypothetical protein
MTNKEAIVLVILGIVLLFFIFVFLIPQLEYQREIGTLTNQLTTCIATATKLEAYGTISNNTTEQQEFFNQATQQLQFCNQIEQQLCNNFGQCSVTKQVLDSIQNGIDSFLKEFQVPISASIVIVSLATALRIFLPKVNSVAPNAITVTKNQLTNYYSNGVIDAETYDEAVSILQDAIEGTLGDISVDFIQGVSVLHSLISYSVVNTVQTLQQRFGLFANITSAGITRFLTMVAEFVNSSIAIELSTFIVDNAIDIAVAGILALSLYGLYTSGLLAQAVSAFEIAGFVALAGA